MSPCGPRLQNQISLLPPPLPSKNIPKRKSRLEIAVDIQDPRVVHADVQGQNLRSGSQFSRRNTSVLVQTFTTWWTFRIFYIFFLLWGGERGVQGAGRGGDYFLLKIPGGGGSPGRGRGGEGLGGCLRGFLGVGGGLNIFFSGPKFPPRQKVQTSMIHDPREFKRNSGQIKSDCYSVPY